MEGHAESTCATLIYPIHIFASAFATLHFSSQRASRNYTGSDNSSPQTPSLIRSETIDAELRPSYSSIFSMEDEAMEWENQGRGEGGGKMTWILNKGLAVGKKILITSLVISSAPVVLPPLMVISTFGLVCAVPYSLFLASYACTEKLITTLLPRPATPITFEEVKMKCDDEKYGGDVNPKNEEKELKQRVEQDETKNEELIEVDEKPLEEQLEEDSLVTFDELKMRSDDKEYGGDVNMENEEEELKQRVDKRLKQDEKRNKELAKVDEKPSEEQVEEVLLITFEELKMRGDDEKYSGDVDIENGEKELKQKVEQDEKRNEELAKVHERPLEEQVEEESLVTFEKLKMRCNGEKYGRDVNLENEGEELKQSAEMRLEQDEKRNEELAEVEEKPSEKQVEEELPVTFEELKMRGNDEKYGGDVDMENEEKELKQKVEMRLEQDEKRNEELAKVDENPLEEQIEEETSVTFEELKMRGDDEKYGGNVNLENEEEELKQSAEVRLEQDEKRNEELAKVEEKPPEEQIEEELLVTFRMKGNSVKCGGDVDMENEEKMLKHRVEMRLEQDGKRNEELAKVDGKPPENQVEEESPVNFGELKMRGDDEKYRGNVDLENEEEELKHSIEIRLEQDEKRNKELAKVDEKPSEEQEIEEKLAKMDEKSPEEICGIVIATEGEDKKGSNAREEEVPFEVTDVATELCQSGDLKGNEELVRDTTELLQKIKDEGMSDDEQGKDKQSVEGEHVGANEGLKKIDRNVQDIVTPLADIVAHGGRVQDTVDNHVKQNHKFNTDTVDSRESANESGSNLLDDIKEVHIQYSTNNEILKGSVQSSYENADFLEITVPSKVHAPKSGGIASNEDLYSEEQIWKQIDVMHSIVGYAGARHATCIEELKALYVYTGVEPPAAFKDPADLVEINAKLRFLMSIIGVK